ncbi:hypothetical protein LguiB_001614 [Lonicera macranthoides]
MTMKRPKREEDREVETLAMANCLMLLSCVGKAGPTPGRVFKCKTCNKQFKSFQALGGHRASHKKRKLLTGGGVHVAHGSPIKLKTHRCTVCRLEFPIGQALGGHMRLHRDRATFSGGSSSRSEVVDPRALWLDLNLTPYENDLRFEKRGLMFDCFL